MLSPIPAPPFRCRWLLQGRQCEYALCRTPALLGISGRTSHHRSTMTFRLAEVKQYGSSLNRGCRYRAGQLAGEWHSLLRTGQPFTLDSSGCLVVNGGCGPELITGKHRTQRHPVAVTRVSGSISPTSVCTLLRQRRFDGRLANQGLSEGNVGLQSNVGPPTRTLDFSIFKDFAITERFKLEFRAEGTNVANTPQFSSPSNSTSSGNFGQITSTQAGTERHIQFQLRLRF